MKVLIYLAIILLDPCQAPQPQPSTPPSPRLNKKYTGNYVVKTSSVPSIYFLPSLDGMELILLNAIPTFLSTATGVKQGQPL